MKSFIGGAECLYMQPIITLFDFEHIKLIKFFQGHRVSGHYLVDKKVFIYIKKCSNS